MSALLLQSCYTKGLLQVHGCPLPKIPSLCAFPFVPLGWAPRQMVAATSSADSRDPVSPLAISLPHTLAPITVSLLKERRGTGLVREMSPLGLEGGPRPLPSSSLNPGGGWSQGSVGKLF